ncbi:histidine phosphatase family protein [Candidatus Sumerlaeota bacterium]|nr:histidine phosphatase family protein [Candidatus Sumerlaeota bacterium]
MGNLYLVRHGQASFFESDYDKLSPMGEAQARKLGEFWLRHGIRADEVHCGTLQRQRRTAEIVGECYAAAGMPWPDPQMNAAFNEYDADGVIKNLLPLLVERDAKFRALSEANAAAREKSERYKHFHRMLEAVMRVWVEGNYETNGAPPFETWREFSARVREGLRSITRSKGGGKRIALFTSGGPIGTAVQTVMQSPDQTALELNWRVHNGSVTEIVFSESRFTLSSFNAIAHLDEPALWTYR